MTLLEWSTLHLSESNSSRMLSLIINSFEIAVYLVGWIQYTISTGAKTSTCGAPGPSPLVLPPPQEQDLVAFGAAVEGRSKENTLYLKSGSQ